MVGQVKEGMLADLVLWKPENFGAKPEMVLKSGVIVFAQVRCVCMQHIRPQLVLNDAYFRWATRMPLSRRSSQYSRVPCGGRTPDLQH